MKYKLLLATYLTVLTVHAQEPAKPQPLPVPLPLLFEAAQAALATCSAAGWPVSLTVVDLDLTTRLALRDAGASAGTLEVSRRKAYTAAKTGMSSEEFAKSLKPEDIITPSPPPGSTRSGEPSVRNGDPMLLPKAGGLLIQVDGKIVGAMGISGRPAGGDVDCVKAGLLKIAAARQ